MADDPVLGQWDLGGIMPSWIIDNDWKDNGDGTTNITLHCAAQATELVPARWEIHDILEISCSAKITNKERLNGGYCNRFPSNCDKLVIKEGLYSWDGIVGPPEYKEDSLSGDMIEWTIPVTVVNSTRTLIAEDPREEAEP